MCFCLLRTVRAVFARMHLFAAGTESVSLSAHPMQGIVGTVMGPRNEGVALVRCHLMQSTDGFGLAPIRAHGSAGRGVVIVRHTLPY